MQTQSDIYKLEVIMPENVERRLLLTDKLKTFEFYVNFKHSARHKCALIHMDCLSSKTSEVFYMKTCAPRDSFLSAFVNAFQAEEIKITCELSQIIKPEILRTHFEKKIKKQL